MTSTAPVQAHLYVRHGRLLVHCPWCPSAEYAHVTDRRFFCSHCLNGPVKGAPIRVEWPEDFAQIEAVLIRRPDPMTRNWERGETVADLQAENASHGVR